MKKYLVVSEENGEYIIHTKYFDEVQFFDSVDEARKEIEELMKVELKYFGDIKTHYYVHEFDTDKLYEYQSAPKPSDLPFDIKAHDGIVTIVIPEKEKEEAKEVNGLVRFMAKVLSKVTNTSIKATMVSASGVDTKVVIDLSDYTKDSKEAVELVKTFIDVFREVYFAK